MPDPNQSGMTYNGGIKNRAFDPESPGSKRSEVSMCHVEGGPIFPFFDSTQNNQTTPSQPTATVNGITATAGARRRHATPTPKRAHHGVPAPDLRGAVPPPDPPFGVRRGVVRAAPRLPPLDPRAGQGGGQDPERGDALPPRRRRVAVPEGSPRTGGFFVASLLVVLSGVDVARAACRVGSSRRCGGGGGVPAAFGRLSLPGCRPPVGADCWVQDFVEDIK